MFSALAAFLVATALAALGQQPTHPTQGPDIGDPSFDWDVVLPPSVKQCEPFLIYYNTTVFPTTNSSLTMHIRTPNYQAILISFTFPPNSIGYMDWICNIPAGYSFIAEAQNFPQYYTVEPGSSSDCLGNITATSNAFYGYETSVFLSYTQNAALSDPPLSSSYQQPPVIYPTNSYSTITLNTFLAVTTTQSSTHSSTASSPPSSTSSSSAAGAPSHKSNTGAIAGGVVGGVALLLLTLAIFAFFMRRRKTPLSEPDVKPFIMEIGPIAHSGLTTSQPTYVTTPFTGHFPLPDTVDGSELASNTESSVPVIPPSVAGTSTSHVEPYSSETSKIPYQTSVMSPLSSAFHPYQPSTTETWNTRSDLASALGVASRLTADQRQTLIASLNGSSEGWEPSLPVEETPPRPSSSGSDPQEETPDLATILGVIARARLSTRERDALVASLSNMTLRGQPNLARGDSVSSPPPYAG